MPIWDRAAALVLERSSAGNTARVLGPGEAPIALCDDAGTVVGADGSTLMTAPLSFPQGARSRPTEALVEVAGAGGAAAGALAVRRYTFTPFSKRLTLALLDATGAEVGELSAADRKGRELTVNCEGIAVVRLELAERDRGIARTVERWSLRVETPPSAPCDLLAAAALMRYGKLLAEVAAQSDRGFRRL